MKSSLPRSTFYTPTPALSNLLRTIMVIALVTLLPGCKKEEKVEQPPPVKPVKLYTIKSGEEEVRMTLPGRVRAAARSELSFKVAGPLQDLPVEEGQVVKKGDLIAQILPRDFRTAINEAKAREREADQQYQRYKELYSKRQVSKADFDRYRASRDVARARLEDAENALKDTTLRAPFDGVIAKRYVENFEKVQQNQAIVFLQLIDQLEILIDVPELMMAHFRRQFDLQVTAEFDSTPDKKYPLAVKEYSTDADATTQTYQVVLSMPQPKEANILPGMTAKVTASASEGPIRGSQILVPAIAVLNDADNKNYVWLFDRESMSVKKKEIIIGSLKGTQKILVQEGLNSGEEIVMAGVTKLQEGMTVRPWKNQREGK